MIGHSLTILFLIKKIINDPRAPAREPQTARRVNVTYCRRQRARGLGAHPPKKKKKKYARELRAHPP